MSPEGQGGELLPTQILHLLRVNLNASLMGETAGRVSDEVE